MRSRLYPILKDRVLLRRFEVPLLYDARKDELYELDEESFELLNEFDGGKSLEHFMEKHYCASGEVEELLEYCIEEGLVELIEKRNEDGEHLECKNRNRSEHRALKPSLRHLLIHITFQCNLRCRHCYLPKKQSSMDVEVFKLLLDEFDKVGGLKVMISGGEPLLHSKLDEMLRIANEYDFRKVLITNGILIDEKNCNLEVDEVQISIDGVRGHDLLRAKNTFEKAVNAVELLRNAGVDVSVATMVNEFNIHEFEEMEKIFKSLGLKSWMVDYPSPEGDLVRNTDILVDFSTAGKIMRRYGFINSGHRSHGEYGCGAHMCASDPEGNISRCGFFEPVGNIREGIETCWEKLRAYLWKIEDLKGCKGCEHLSICKGGCRFRAKCLTSDIWGKDPVMCAVFGRSS
jgi:radical SAM protein with 4Fe4S-binding SPASM domain